MMNDGAYLDLLNSLDRLAASVCRIEERLDRMERTLRLPTPEEALQRAVNEGYYWQTRTHARPSHSWSPSNTCAANPNYSQL